jgi:hypothetical protein
MENGEKHYEKAVEERSGNSCFEKIIVFNHS